jgi:hypothetical protein
MLRRNALSTLVAVPSEGEPAVAAPQAPLPVWSGSATTDPAAGSAVERP